MIVSKSRSLIKSLTWRVVALITTFISIYAVSGELKVAWLGTLLTNAVNFVLYYLHERAWNKTSWGRS
jgi:adenylylsulfate kinase